MNRQNAPLAAPGLVQRRDREGVAVLRLNGPDGNRMSPALVGALAASLEAVLADPAVEGVVLTGGAPGFCAGAYADLPLPGPDPQTLPPVMAALADLCDRIEGAAKPVVAALSGRVASGGLALALAAGARIAAPGTVFLCPEARLGRLPPGGAAVRMAWQIGAGPALTLIGGRAMGAQNALAAGLVEAVADDPVAAAIARVLDLGAAPRSRARPGLDDPAGFAGALAEARAALPAPLPPHRLPDLWLLDALEAAQLLPPEQALAFDRARAEDATLRPEARMLAHVALAARRAQEPEPRPVEGAVCLALDAPTAARLVPILLREGVSVLVMGRDRETLAATLERVAEAQFAQVRAGRLTQAEAEEDWTRVAGRLRLDPDQPPAVALADPAHLAWLEAALPADVPLAAWEPPADWLAGLAHPARALALLPAPTRPVRLCELVERGTETAPVQAPLSALALQLRMTALRVQEGPVLTPLIRAAARAAARLRAAGASPEALTAVEILPQGLAEGQAAEIRAELPLPLDRLILLAVANEGMRLLAAGRALRPSDLDLALVMGAGWPQWRGGPMAEADALGPMVLRHELRIAAALDPDLWTPEPILDEMIRRGWRFADLNETSPG
ncbi:enoyl-CoA hydratase-related protein [Pararhodobacter sp.]|uniref:enoyl-CoA hydratase-related protein n=1 Tax=Pararhodobacter sp. TaxID=2127056 RepID=UPI002AFFA65D|nr:enoyl-CoA hydratase-related protein [Pararhodobacter sp.]